MKPRKPPRDHRTYRAYRRNLSFRELGLVWEGRKPNGSVYHPPVRMNRSRKWDGVAIARPYR